MASSRIEAAGECLDGYPWGALSPEQEIAWGSSLIQEALIGPEERELRSCTCGGAWVQEPCDPTCISWESTYQEREGE